MKVYLAAPWQCINAARRAADYLRERGLEVVSTWTDQTDTDDPEQLAVNARRDWDELQRADALIVLNMRMSEGKATEMGGAIMRGIRVLVVGSKETQIFHYLRHEVEMVESIGRAADLLCQQRLEWPADPWAV